jgi:hypothetical protein
MVMTDVLNIQRKGKIMIAAPRISKKYRIPREIPWVRRCQ